MQNYAVAVRTALQRMQLTGSYQLWQIDYSKPGISAAGANSACTSAGCKLFDPQGGGVSAVPLSPELKQPVSECPAVPGYAGRHWFRNIGIKNVGMDGNRDLTLIYPGVSKEFCMAVNTANGITNPSGAPPNDSESDEGCSYFDYSGNMTQEIAFDNCASPELGVKEPSAAGKQMMCMLQGDCYYLWIVLKER